MTVSSHSLFPYPAGYIDLEELKLIVGCLLVDEIKSTATAPENGGAGAETTAAGAITVKHIEDLFHTIDQDGTGKIDFEEFNVFFETILRSPTLLSTSSQREGEATTEPEQDQNGGGDTVMN
jgi:hypothetical protein